MAGGLVRLASGLVAGGRWRGVAGAIALALVAAGLALVGWWRGVAAGAGVGAGRWAPVGAGAVPVGAVRTGAAAERSVR